jgi:hypothetical protein
MCPLSKGHAPAIHGHPAGGGTAAGVNSRMITEKNKFFNLQLSFYNKY